MSDLKLKDLFLKWLKISINIQIERIVTPARNISTIPEEFIYVNFGVVTMRKDANNAALVLK